jgi:heptosyltransferase-1
LGDLVFATSLLQGLKNAWPQAQVDWLVQPEFASFLRTQPDIADIPVWPRKDWAALWRNFAWLALAKAIYRFALGLRAQRYDLVIDAQGLAKSRALAWLAGGKRRIGYASKEPLGFLLHEQFKKSDSRAPYADKHIAQEHRALVQHLTGSYGPAPFLQAASGAGNTVVLAPFTTRPQKHWPEAHWAALIDLLAEQGEHLALLGGPADAAAASRILSAASHGTRVENWVGKTTLPDALSRIAAAKAVVGVDTGLTHMGVATVRPTVAIFGSTVPYRLGATGPLAVLWLGLSCSPCKRKPTCGGAFNCLGDITPARVLGSLNALLRPVRV